MYKGLSKRYPGRYCIYQDCLLETVLEDNLDFNTLKTFNNEKYCKKDQGINQEWITSDTVYTKVYQDDGATVSGHMHSVF